MAKKPKHNFQIRMDKSLFRKIKIASEIENRSMTSLIHAMLNEGLKSREFEIPNHTVTIVDGYDVSDEMGEEWRRQMDKD